MEKVNSKGRQSVGHGSRRVQGTGWRKLGSRGAECRETMTRHRSLMSYTRALQSLEPIDPSGTKPGAPGARRS